MYEARLSLCSATQLPTAVCGVQMPDRGGAVRPTDARSRWCCAAHARPTSAPRRWPGEGICNIEAAE
ncbi:hypothetical protein Y032_0092g2560 [Ancylostoma ceylanicum]|uniref:Uncharacterized protein n=1 Tax=Ancylostoma ceylanicum TaxID=53326 RepID=A0A016TMD2_9BILA|nr:hypothetical protein Y032_0092g2560 [Ancylostoma ceylanicum]